MCIKVSRPRPDFAVFREKRLEDARGGGVRELPSPFLIAGTYLAAITNSFH
jgi:hypothetical protein